MDFETSAVPHADEILDCATPAPFPSQSFHLHNQYLSLDRLELDIIDSLKDLTRRSDHNPLDVWDGIPINDIWGVVLEGTPNLTEASFQ